ncbi:hypothetical protein WJX81_003499 [Elliptochloris bilobata]|uniref:Uncharacterized protein n=1 Tax=Elliptochloris bilobata TaxID=381761 RepID=A0AAW1RSI7_9CHLO
MPRPASLPEPPSSSRLLDVMPYLLKLATTDRQLWWRLGGAVLLMFASKAAGLATPMYLKRAVDALGGVVTDAGVRACAMALLASGACRVVNSLTKELQGPIFTPVSQAAGRRVAYHTFQHVLDLDINFHLERRTGALSRILERGTRSVAMVFRAVVFTFIPTAIELVLVCGLLARTFAPAVAALVVATFAAYVLWTAALTRAAAEVRKEVNKLDNMTTGKAVDALLNYETVKLFNNEQLEVNEYDEYLVGYQRAAVATEAIAATLNAGQAVVLACGLTAVLVAAATATPAGTFTAGDLVMAQGLLLQLWGPLQFLGWFYRELRQSLVDMDAFFGILKTQPSLPDGARELPATGSAAAARAPPRFPHPGNGATHAAVASTSASAGEGVRGLAVDLRDVRFGYTPEREVLRGVTLSVAPGQSCAIVGSSGSGKSTLLRLLVRLYDVQGGAVLLDGIDIREFRQTSLRSAIAVVPQDTVLFADTIMRNLAYGRPTATRAEILKAAEMAQLGPAVARMKDGYETVVGERGLKLSGGEKQRVAIARAFLRNPRLLICDEATSALDTATERGIMGSLEELAQGRTSVFVAHRLSTVQRCDKIVVLSDGVMAEVGTHSELMAAGRVYYDMWQAQAAAEEQQKWCCPQELTTVPLDAVAA